MTNNYNQVDFMFYEVQSNTTQKKLSSSTCNKRHWLALLSLFLTVFITSTSQKVLAQSSANYAFSTSTAGSLNTDANGNAINMGTGATQLVAAASDQGASAITNLGFNYYFYGSAFSQFSVSANGIMQLGSTAVSTLTYVASGGASSAPKFSAIGSDAMTASATDGGGVFTKLVGTAPNRCLVVQWVSYLYWTNTTSPATFQVRLYETSGQVEYVYGAMPVGATAYTSNYSTGLSVGTIANQLACITTSTNAVSTSAFTTNVYADATNIANLHSTSDGSRRVYKFTPPIPASGPTSLAASGITTSTVTLNWTAAASLTNILKYAVLNSTNGGVTYNFIANVAVGTNTFAATVLMPVTNYTWKVVAISEGAESAATTTTAATLAVQTYYWVGTTGGLLSLASNWNTAANNTGTTRTTVAATDILIVDGDGTTPGGTTTISIDVASFTIGQLLVTGNTNLTLQSSATTARIITISGSPGDDFFVESGSTLNLNNATNPVAFAFSGSFNTGLVAGTINFSGSTSNTITTTGGTSTLVTVAASGVVNLGATGNSLVGSTTTLSFLAGSNCNSTGATTAAPPVPLATWDTTSTLTISGLTTSTTPATNNVQSFGNFVYNCPSSTATMSFFGSSTTALIKGNLTIVAAGATSGAGIFRVVTSGTISVNGNIVVTQGKMQSASSTGTVIANGNTSIDANGILDMLAGTFSQRGNTFTNNGILTGPAGTLQFVNITGTAAQALAGSGTVLTNISTISMQNTAGLTITHTNPIILARVNLFQGIITNSDKITFGTGLAVNCVTQIGSAGLTTPAGSYGALPLFNLGTGTYSVIYAQESVSRNTGFEIPTTRVLNALTVSNSNGLVVNGGVIATGLLTLSAGTGNITTTNTNLLTVTGTTTGSIVRTSSTAYVNGPLAITLPASLATGSSYVLPVGKGTLNPFTLVNPTTNAGGTVTIRSEVFDATTGGTGAGLLGGINSNRYWASSITAGSSNFADTLIQLTDTPNGADAVGGSATLAGSYNLIGGLTTTITATSLTTTSPATTAVQGFYVMGAKATPALSNLAITPSGNRCPAVTRTVTATATPGAGAITGVVINYSVNGLAQTAINMTNSSGNNWSGIIPTVTPANATVVWSVTAIDVNTISKNQIGTTYADNGFNNVPITITSSVPNICAPGGSTTLAASSTITGVTYTWETLTASATLANTTGASVSTTITETSYFKVTGTPADGGCPSVGLITVTVNALPTAITITPTSASICPDVIQSLTATGGLSSSPGTVTIGNATTLTAVNSVVPSAFNNRYKHQWYQTVFSATELSAAGVQAGNITSLTFNISTIGDAPNVTDYKLRMGTVGTTTLTAFTTTGLSLVYSAATYTHAVGANVVTFQTPYVWDGTSNILIDIRSTGGDAVNNAATFFTATTGNTVVSATTSTASTSDGFATTNPSPTASTNRFNMVFGCNKLNSSPITWNPITNLYTDATASTAYVANGNNATVYFKSSTAAATTYTATATSPSTCTKTQTVTITVNSKPATPTITTTAATCAAAGTATVSNYNANVTYVSTPVGATVGASGVITATAGTAYTFTATNASTCTSVASAAVTIVAQLVSPATPTITTTAATCAAAGTATVSNYNADVTYVSTPVGATVGASGVITAIAGTAYTFTATNASTCTSVASAAVTMVAQLVSPATPTINTTAATCAAAGTVTVSNYNANVTYVSTPVGATVGASGVITATAGTAYTLTAANATCTSGSSLAFINAAAFNCDIQFANIQAPGAVTINNCGTTTFYAQVYKVGVTEAVGQGAGITAWIATNTANTDPSTWSASSWQLATFTAQAGNNDEYQYAVTGLAQSTYYVASRFQSTGGAFYYGGYTATGGGAWGGANTSAVLTVTNVAAPTGSATQDACATATIADLVVTGSNLLWYATASSTTVLPTSTIIVAGTTYFVSQTVSGCTSPSRLSVVANGPCLGLQVFKETNFSYYPNPVTDILQFKYSHDISTIKVINILGQELNSKIINSKIGEIDMSYLPSATYVVKIISEDREKIIKVVKK